MSTTPDLSERAIAKAGLALRRARDRLGPLADSAVLETRRLSTQGIEKLIIALEKLRDKIDPDKPETEDIANQALETIDVSSNTVPDDANPTPVPNAPSSPPAPATPSSPEARELDSRFRLETGQHYIKGRADQDVAYHKKLLNNMEIAIVLDGAGRGSGENAAHPEAFVYNTLINALESIPSNKISEETIKAILKNVHNTVRINFQGSGHAGVDMVLAVPGNEHPFVIHIGEGNSATISSSGISRLFNPHQVTQETPNANLTDGVWRTPQGSKALNMGVDSNIIVDIQSLSPGNPIIIASDGFWDMFDYLQIDNTKVISLINEGKHDEAAKYLATTARTCAEEAKIGNVDDICVMIVKPSVTVPSTTAEPTPAPTSENNQPSAPAEAPATVEASPDKIAALEKKVASITELVNSLAETLQGLASLEDDNDPERRGGKRQAILEKLAQIIAATAGLVAASGVTGAQKGTDDSRPQR